MVHIYYVVIYIKVSGLQGGCTSGCRKYQDTLFSLKLNQITPSKLWTQTRCIPDLNTCCRKLPYLEIEKIFGLLCHFLRSRVLKYFFGPKPCTQLKSTCKTVLDSILNKVIWYMHCGEKSPVNSQLSMFLA